MNPAVVGWFFAPRMPAMRPSSTATSSAQVSGQSIGQVVLSVVMESSRIFSSPRRRDARANMSHGDSPWRDVGELRQARIPYHRRVGEVPQEHNQADKQYKMPYACESKRANPASNDGLGSEGDSQCQSAPEVCTLGSLLL